MEHETLKINAEEAINALFSDTSVSRPETKESLEEIASMVDDFLQTLDD